MNVSTDPSPSIGPAVKGDLLALDRLDGADLRAILHDAQVMRRAWQAGSLPRVLEGWRFALIVDDSGWRNTTAFDLGVQAMGGTLTHAPIGFDQRREEPDDVARFLDNWFDLVVIRTRSLAVLERVAAASRRPVINARTRNNHPCEVLGDLSFVLTERGRVEGLKVAMVGPDANILRSWIEVAAVLPILLTQVFAAPWHVPPDDRRVGTADFRVTDDVMALADADVIVTDCWPAHEEQDKPLLARFQIGPKLVASMKVDALLIPCPPVKRGEDVAPEAIVDPRCRVFEAKAYLLHAQNAVLARAVALRPPR